MKDRTVNIPDDDIDVTLVFPSGKKVVIQARPSNGHTDEDGNVYNGSLDIILPEENSVTVWSGVYMQDSKETDDANTRLGDQIVLELP